MNRLFLTLLFSAILLTASSQKIYFIYLQTDPQQPFFVKMDNKLLSSSASGYLVLPKLKDSTYTFSIGFAGGNGGEHKFICNVNKKDHGFLIKNFGEKGWGLYDLQTSAVQMAVNNAAKDGAASDVKVNAFTELLSKAADDSTLKQKVVMPVEEKKPEATTTAAKTENTVVNGTSGTVQQKVVVSDAVPTVVTSAAIAVPDKKDERPKETAKVVEGTGITTAATKTIADESKTAAASTVNAVSQPVEEPKKEIVEKANDSIVKETNSQAAPSFTKTKVTRKSESSTTEGFGLTYIDTYPDGKQDTISLVIPNESMVKLTDNKSAEGSVESKAAQPTDKEAIKPVVKNACKSIATDDDFFKLRKKMAAEKSDNGMIGEATKIFKSKCFTTAQLKNLGTLFIGDGGKYQFFDAAYTHVSDIENFATLQSELKDEYFINRFKAMIR